MQPTIPKLADIMVNVTIVSEHLNEQRAALDTMMSMIPNSCAEYRTRQIEYAVVEHMIAEMEAIADKAIDGITAIKEAQDAQWEEDSVPPDFDWNSAAKEFIE